MTPRCLVLAGPTASGKSAAAMAVCEAYGAVLLSCDAMQVYRGMDIGTAKPSREEQERVAHFGIDLVKPDEPFDAAMFREIADEVLAAHPRVVVAGGTSLYIRALIRGLVKTPDVDAELRAKVEAIEDLHGELARVDPVLAERLHPNDRVRLVRGVEVFRASGQRLSELQAAHAEEPDRVDAHALWLDREDLNERIDRRVEIMAEAGYVDEVRALLDAGYARTLKPMQSLGYRHLCDALLDGVELEEALRRTARDTRRFAKKQRNWMRVLGYPKVLREHEQTALDVAKVLWG
ncbi:MAG: tRNA (adenosine(37)-N6)-dimethylallyltransferase MiaA [Proteobacteria bacterium]|nr:tRNA (adenosine(37)-N6)-dimethylallyltransferase MiaA [Pseudomonadota bacterium]